MKKKQKKLIAIIVLTGLGLLVVGTTILIICTKGTKRVPFKTEIESAISVKAMENKFVHTERVFLGGAGAGGLGAPMIYCSSPQQFSDLVPAEESVYVADAVAEDRTVLKRTYWAFIENRAGVIIYEENYSINFPYHIAGYNREYIIFKRDPFTVICMGGIILLSFTMVVGMFTIAFTIEQE